MPNRKVLVTGGAGYVGSHACYALKKAGYEPITFDHLKKGHRELVRFGPLEVGDLGNRNEVETLFETHSFEAVLHFAALTEVKESMEEPARYYENNVLGTLNLLYAMRKFQVNRIVFSSTAATYGAPQTDLIRDDAPQVPMNPYGETKHLVEKMLKDFHQAYGLRSISLRYFNAAGALADQHLGEAHFPESHLIPLLLDTAQGKRDAFTLFGDDYATEDGSCVRDFIHVNDLASAHVLALEYLNEHSVCEGLNCSTEQGYSVKQVHALAETITQKPIPLKIGPRRAGDPPRLVGDAKRTRELLNWKASQSDLKTIIESAWAWHQIKDQIIASPP